MRETNGRCVQIKHDLNNSVKRTINAPDKDLLFLQRLEVLLFSSGRDEGKTDTLSLSFSLFLFLSLSLPAAGIGSVVLSEEMMILLLK